MRLYIYIALPVLLLASCTGSKTDREKKMNTYMEALGDSITSNEARIDSCNSRITVLNGTINDMTAGFAVVNNSREVEGYYILDGWQKRYPLSSTGIIARISDNEQLEIIAALKSATFNTMTVRTPGGNIMSETVPHDQALNYRREGLNTVMFSGSRADSIAALIANNELNNISVDFLEGNAVKGSWQIPDDYKKMISATWRLYSARRELRTLERTTVMLREKINLLRAHRDKNGATSD